MLIEWLDDAIHDLRNLRQYISIDNPLAAKKVGKNIVKTINYLPMQPHMGRLGRVFGTRELIIPGLPYIIPYRVLSHKIQILRVYHASMQWPEQL